MEMIGYCDIHTHVYCKLTFKNLNETTVNSYNCFTIYSFKSWAIYEVTVISCL